MTAPTERQLRYAEALHPGASHADWWGTDVASVMAVADAEQAELRAEVERLWAVIHDVADGEGWTTQIGGALISKCDIYGRTEQHIRAKAAEAKVARVEALHVKAPNGYLHCMECEQRFPCPTIRAAAAGPAEPEATAERGRRLASEREGLIAAGVDSADLLVPLHPADATEGGA